MFTFSYLGLFDISHIHPSVTHFPVAIILVGFLADFISLFFTKEKCLWKMGYWLAILGMVAAMAAWGTGYFLTNPLEGEAGELRATHKLFATLTLITIIVATSFRSIIVYLKKEETNLKWASFGLYFLSAVFVGYTGFLGGALVLNFMIGL